MSNQKQGTRGTLISFEGIDKINKTGFCKQLKKKLGDRAEYAHDPWDPWKNLLPNGINKKLKIGDGEITPISLAFLYLAARLDCYEKIIKPALEKGKIVIADRYIDSWTAYQSVYAEENIGENSKNFFQEFHDKCVKKGILSYPDITVLITMDIGEVYRRIKKIERKPNIYEGDPKKLEKTQECYLSICRENKETFICIVGNGKSNEEIYEEIEEELRSRGFEI